MGTFPSRFAPLPLLILCIALLTACGASAPPASAPATVTATVTQTVEATAAETTVTATGEPGTAAVTVTETVQVTETTTPSAAPTLDEPEADAAPEPPGSMTRSQEQAIGSAQSYLEFTHFSKKGLIQQLASEYGEGFSAADAEFAVQHLEDQGLVDWKAQAVGSAESYLEFTHFSRSGLIEQLTSDYGEQFTLEQAEYAADAVGL